MIYHFIMEWLIFNEIAALWFLRIAEIEHHLQQDENEATRLWLLLRDH